VVQHIRGLTLGMKRFKFISIFICEYLFTIIVGAVRILRDAEEDDNADSDCEMLPNKSADFSKTTYTNADLQSLDSKA